MKLKNFYRKTVMKLSNLKLSNLFSKTPTKQSKQLEAYNLARTFIGMKEVVGTVHNEEIVKMFAEVGHSWVKDDETAWCASFIGAMFERTGTTSTRRLDARSYLKFGVPVSEPDAKEGDVVIFWRVAKDSWQGHVGFFIRYTSGGDIVVLGGNQSNQVSEAVYKHSRLLGFTRAE